MRLYAVYFKQYEKTLCDLYMAEDEQDAYRQFCLEYGTDCIVQRIAPIV